MEGMIHVFGRSKTTRTSSFDETRALWDELRSAARTESEREEIDAIFSRQVP